MEEDKALRNAAQPGATYLAQRQAPAPARQGRGGNAGNGNWYMCTAEASLGISKGTGPVSWKTKSAVADGPSKDAAAVQVLKDCGSIVGFDNSLAWQSGDTVEGGDCKITNCIGGW